MTVTWDAGSAPSGATLSNGNLTATQTVGSNAYRNVRANTAIVGKKYWMVQETWGLGNSSGTGQSIGVMNASHAMSDVGPIGNQDVNGGSIRPDGVMEFNGFVASDIHQWLDALTTARWILVAYDQPSNLLWVNGNEGWDGRASVADDPASGVGGLDCTGIGATVYPAVSLAENGDVFTADFFGVSGSFASEVAALVAAGFTALDSGSSSAAVLFAQSVL